MILFQILTQFVLPDCNSAQFAVQAGNINNIKKIILEMHIDSKLVLTVVACRCKCMS